MNDRQHVQRYCDYFASLTLESITALPEYFSEVARFKDPFNDVIGLKGISRVFEHMFKQVHEPAFSIIDMVCEENVAFIRWHFRYAAREGSMVRKVEGVSRVVFDYDGKALEHIDYWDPVEGVYQFLPIIGRGFRWITRTVSSV